MFTPQSLILDKTKVHNGIMYKKFDIFSVYMDIYLHTNNIILYIKFLL